MSFSSTPFSFSMETTLLMTSVARAWASSIFAASEFMAKLISPMSGFTKILPSPVTEMVGCWKSGNLTSRQASQDLSPKKIAKMTLTKVIIPLNLKMFSMNCILADFYKKTSPAMFCEALKSQGKSGLIPNDTATEADGKKYGARVRRFCFLSQIFGNILVRTRPERNFCCRRFLRAAGFPPVDGYCFVNHDILLFFKSLKVFFKS